MSLIDSAGSYSDVVGSLPTQNFTVQRRPLTETWSWQFAARCRGEDPTNFYTVDGERGADLRRREQEAKALCADCLVSQQCLRFAVDTRERFGIWGGLTPLERGARTPR